MFLGIEIGGTKLQLGVGPGDGTPLAALVRYEVDPSRGSAGILAQIEAAAAALAARHPLQAVGVGFGGPVDASAGRVLKSHHVDGWEQFPIVPWCHQVLGLNARVINDCDAAALAEARFGAGRGSRVVLYVTVGTGIGGGLVVDGQLYQGGERPAAELGHLRPGIHCDLPDQTLESLASGWGIAAAAQARLSDPCVRSFRSLTGGGPKHARQIQQRMLAADQAAEEFAADLRARCGGQPDQLTARHVAQAAAEGNVLAGDVIAQAVQALGWGVAQAVTLLAPGAVVVGGGVSLMEPSLFLQPLAEHLARYVFPPLAGSYRLVPAAFGEEVVVHGALALAASLA
jgi:glucokinase